MYIFCIVGEIAFRFLNYVKSTNVQKGCHVTVCDVNEHMLNVAKKRCEEQKFNPEMITWRKGDAEKLPFTDDSFNAYTIAFGIRYCMHIDKVLINYATLSIFILTTICCLLKSTIAENIYYKLSNKCVY